MKFRDLSSTLLRKLGYRNEGHEGIVTPVHESTRFVLRYGDLEVGALQLQDGVWEFRYTPAFLQQSDVLPLVDFPLPGPVFTAESLWPFFMARIPSVEQPKVREAIDREGLDEHSDVELLRRFGKRTIANPFVLQEAS